MSELTIPSIEKEDISPPKIEAGGTAIVLQRHEKYDRDRSSERSGSVFEDAAEAAKERALAFFKELLSNEDPNSPTYVFFGSSDTQYNNKGRRSLETAELAQQACIEVMESLGINPAERILNLNTNHSLKKFDSNQQGQDLNIRPIIKLREPNIFGDHDNHRLGGIDKEAAAKSGDRRYFDYMIQKHGSEGDEAWTPEVWAIHEKDGEEEKRRELGAEGVYDILDRTKRALAGLARYSEAFHDKNPEAKLLLWVTSHYDTISPLVKDAQGISLKGDEYLKVDYGGGVVINLPKGGETVLEARSQKVPLAIGRVAVG
ncbi:MAG TPA: hypothetical protein VFT49_03275 [Candidatus Saccharimonadales bacterium]|nr:hypothetical protein [Candidatus Saccharimonadales bacterium]